MDAGLAQRLRRIRLVAFDVDGVLTDGRLYRGPDGFEMKVFHTRDGHGLKALMRAEITVAVISGRQSRAVAERMDELGVTAVYLGIEAKRDCLEQLCAEQGIAADQAAFMGDDVVDLAAMQHAGVGAAPADAHPRVREQAHWLADADGGFGAARQFCDRILAARDLATDYAGN